MSRDHELGEYSGADAPWGSTTKCTENTEKERLGIESDGYLSKLEAVEDTLDTRYRADFQTCKAVGHSWRIGTGSSLADLKVCETAASHPWHPGVRPGITCEADVVRTAAARLEARPTDVTVIQ